MGCRAVSAEALQPIQVVGMVIGGMLTSLVLLGIDRIADNTQKEFERAPLSRFIDLPPDAVHRRWGFDEDLTSPCFFAHAPAGRRHLWYHRAAMVVVGVVVGIQAVDKAAAAGANLGAGRSW